MTSVILDSDLEIPVILSMGVGESFIEKMDLNKDGVEEYVIAECEKASGDTLYYGLCVVREINGHYSLTRYDSNYFLEYFRENTRFNYEEDTGKFWMIEVVPAFQSRCTTGSFKTNRKESPVAIEYTGGLYVDFEDDDVVISAPVGLVYSDNPVPDYSDGIMSRCMAYCMADHSLTAYLISFASAE